MLSMLDETMGHNHTHTLGCGVVVPQCDCHHACDSGVARGAGQRHFFSVHAFG